VLDSGLRRDDDVSGVTEVTVLLVLVAIAMVLGLALLLVKHLLIARILRQLNERMAREQADRDDNRP
jgi:hypothetical protein